MTPVPGDPGSLSSCAAAVGAVGTRLAVHGETVRRAFADLAEGWPGPRSVRTRRRGAALGVAAGAAADELAEVARVLQDQATDLAELVARARGVGERARAHGLEVRDGRVVPALGVLGEADLDADRRRAETAATLQAELDLVLARHRRRRDAVVAALRASTHRLDVLAHDVRLR
ncbi:hypothetical protein [uncultured Phycicoccus sp.]|uniref:hypothetical protein n=1 Tax=uncultured Phycicoccus sp. TaxID=661422 RepID=UPI00262AE913|nr:hypothetical protein [uncultured Phycicoccus sp.]